MDLNLGNAVFATYSFYAAILLLKVVCMALFVTKKRVAKLVFANPEDCTTYAPDKPNHQPQYNDPEVEKARRMHMHDVENIPVFILVGLLYVLSGPSAFLAGWHFRIYTACRIAHTFFYYNAKAFPRFIAHLSALAIIFSMGLQVLVATL